MPNQQPIDPLTTTVAELCDRGLCDDPTEVGQEVPFRTIVRAFLKNPAVRTVAVVDEARKVVGLISVRSLYEAMFVDLFPSAALGEISDLTTALEVMHDMQHRTAAELMDDPVVVTLSDQVNEACIRIHREHMDGLPVVDGDGRLVSYLDQSALAPLWLERGSE